MPTISSSLVQPLVTPSTALFTSARARPCTAACESFSRTASNCPSCCSTRTPLGSAVSTLPLGPCTETTLPSTLILTPCGTAIGFLPILDIKERSQLSALSRRRKPRPLDFSALLTDGASPAAVAPATTPRTALHRRRPLYAP